MSLLFNLVDDSKGWTAEVKRSEVCSGEGCNLDWQSWGNGNFYTRGPPSGIEASLSFAGFAACFRMKYYKLDIFLSLPNAADPDFWSWRLVIEACQG